MLKRLTIWNFALIEHVALDFGSGLNILTGETGAGKSILIGAIGLILGQRSSTETIRSGCEYLRVEAVFDIGANRAAQEFLNENGIINDSDELFIARRLSRSGKNIILANGCRINLAALRLLGRLLIDVHGQNENQTLFEKASQLQLVDSTSKNVKEIRQEYRLLYDVYVAKRQALAEKLRQGADNERQMDILNWQIDEIANSKIAPGEKEELEGKIKRLSNAEKIAEHIGRAYELVEAGENSALSSLSLAIKDIEQLGKYDEKFTKLSEALEQCRIELQESSYEIRDCAEDAESNPQALNELLRRSDEIARLCRKYGPLEQDVLSYYEKILAERDEIENYEAIIASLRKSLEELEPRLNEAAERLTAIRKKNAAQLTELLSAQIRQLGMEYASFKIDVTSAEDYLPTGHDAIEALFSANPGEPLQLVQKVASGGEQSRIALAIKAVAAAKDAPETMIFDEIDTGIGGKTAQKVAERIASIAFEHQVLCITHLPQIAAMADVHFYIEKNVAENRTVTAVKHLSDDERVQEIARMVFGDDLSSLSLENARQMLGAAHEKKDLLQKERRVAYEGQ